MFQHLNDLDGGALLNNVCVRNTTVQKANIGSEFSANPPNTLMHGTGIWPYGLPLRGTFALEALVRILTKYTKA